MAETKFPVPKFNFKVTFRGSEGGTSGEISFQEVSGLDQEAEYLEYRTGTMKEMVTLKRLGLVRTSTVSLKRGVAKGESKINDLFSKIYELKDFYSESTNRLTVMIQLLDEEGAPIMRWIIKNAVPVKLVGTNLKSDANEVSIEQIDLVHEGIESKY